MGLVCRALIQHHTIHCPSCLSLLAAPDLDGALINAAAGAPPHAAVNGGVGTAAAGRVLGSDALVYACVAALLVEVAAGCVLLLAGPVCCVGYGAYLASRIIAAG